MSDRQQVLFRSINRIVEPAVRRGLGSPPPVGVGLVVIETTGRVSGLPRRVPLVAARFGDRVRVGTVRGSSRWWSNLDALPEAAVWVCGRRRTADASLSERPMRTAELRLTD